MYFITICTLDKRCTLGRVAVGHDACDMPATRLSDIGTTVEKHIHLIDNRYNNIFIDKYVIMPNHVHMLIAVCCAPLEEYKDDIRASFYGTSQASCPTSAVAKTALSSSQSRQHELIPKFVSIFKRSCNHEVGHNIWQSRYYDHVVREEKDYLEIVEYIENNPVKWAEDKYFCD